MFRSMKPVINALKELKNVGAVLVAVVVLAQVQTVVSLLCVRAQRRCVFACWARLSFFVKGREKEAHYIHHGMLLDPGKKVSLSSCCNHGISAPFFVTDMRYSDAPKMLLLGNGCNTLFYATTYDNVSSFLQFR